MTDPGIEQSDDPAPLATATPASDPAFSVQAGRQAADDNGDTVKVFLAVAFGVLLHFVWEIAVAVVKHGDDATIGGWKQLAARTVIAFVVAFVGFVGIYKQLESVDPKVRYFQAISLGFAADALTNPLAPIATLEAV